MTACISNPTSTDLSDWTSVGDARWVLEKHGVKSSTTGLISYLISDRIYRDYRLDLEFYPTAQVNSGVFLNCQSQTEIDATSCHEVNIWDDHPRQEFRTGAIVTKVYPPKVHLNTVGKWNRYSIIVRNGGVSVLLNGQETAVLSSSELTEGYIALQKAEGGEIRFRNIVITPL